MINRILMAVYNEIDFDGRVQRAAEALGSQFKVTVISIDSGYSYKNSSFISLPVTLPKMILFKQIRLLIFWLKFLWIAITYPSKLHIIYIHDYYLTLPGLIAAKVTKSKLIYDAHELFIPENNMKYNLRMYFFYFLEKFIISRSDLVIACNKERAKIMQDHFHLKKMPIVVRNIPPSPKTILSKEEIFKLYPQIGKMSKEQINIVYQGDLNLTRRIDLFIFAMKMLDHPYKMYLIGRGPDANKIKKIIEINGLEDKVVCFGMIPRKHLYDVLRFCHLGIICYPESGLNNLFCAPNKIFEYAQAGLPMISTCQPSLKPIFNKFQIGIMVGCGDKSRYEIIHEIADSIQFISDNYDLFRANLPNFLEMNSWENEIIPLLNNTYKLLYD